MVIPSQQKASMSNITHGDLDIVLWKMLRRLRLCSSSADNMSGASNHKLTSLEEGGK
jgi:hypothetical protein